MDCWAGATGTAGSIAPGNLRRTVETLLEARNSEIDRVAIETAERTVDDCDHRMARGRTTLDAGGGPQEIVVVVAAAPTHVRSVRQFVLDPLTAADRQALARIAAKLRIRPVDLA
jgi:hypothetical protein